MMRVLDGECHSANSLEPNQEWMDEGPACVWVDFVDCGLGRMNGPIAW